MTTAESILLRVLQDHHLPCPVCGYDLHRLTAPRCTECGKLLTLNVFLANPPLRRAWIILLAAAGLNAALGLLSLLVLILGRFDARQSLFPRGAFFDLAFYLQFHLIPWPLFVLLARRHFQKLPRALQWILALALALWGIIIFCGMASHLR